MITYLQISTTVPSEDMASRLARSITENRLAACVQIVGPIRSIYWWQGNLENSQEWLLQIKATLSLFPALEKHIKANHSYETPEIIATEIVTGNAEYLAWISAETKRSGASS
ncbi:divalent-cation tolerance protein CutA [Sphaerisporangium dianthi]|uniref:Divalent-cation tolerance protein CutA n=1 Tax=Sphaerisporangium dianthi TaxID=1436120 RepID=A0ABV9CSH4_9ACTN